MRRNVWGMCLMVFASLAQAQLHLDCAEVFRPANDRLLLLLANGGIAAQCHYMPPARAAQQVVGGELDGSLLRTESFGKAFPDLLRVEPSAHQVLLVLYRREGSAIDTSNWREQAIVTLRGTVVLDRMLAGLNVSRVSNLESGLKQLSVGRADVLLGDSQRVPELIQLLGVANVEAVYPPIATQLLYLYLNPEHADKINAISAVLMHETGP